MARKSIPSWNPIRRVRLDNHKTLEEFASECHIHLQAVYLNEMGMYPTILPSIMRTLHGQYGIVPTVAEDEYKQYVTDKRLQFGSDHEPYELGESSLSRSPLTVFRRLTGFPTAFGFANAIAINPTIIRRVESCKVEDFPGQLNLALRDIRLPVGDIDELQYRHREYYHSGLRLKSRTA